MTICSRATPGSARPVHRRHFPRRSRGSDRFDAPIGTLSSSWSGSKVYRQTLHQGLREDKPVEKEVAASQMLEPSSMFWALTVGHADTRSSSATRAGGRRGPRVLHWHRSCFQSISHKEQTTQRNVHNTSSSKRLTKARCTFCTARRPSGQKAPRAYLHAFACF